MNASVNSPRSATAIPLVAIVGRPNVGKSTLFNGLLGLAQKAITFDQDGVTRDRQYGIVALDTLPGQPPTTLVVADTGGFFAGTPVEAPVQRTAAATLKGQALFDLMAAQVALAIEDADLVLFVFDGRQEPLPHDFAIIQYLRQQGKTFWAVANKIDHPGLQAMAEHGRQMGCPTEDYFVISAAHQQGLGELKQRLQLFAQKNTGHHAWPQSILPQERLASRLAIIGAPNVGKSTLLNALLKKERALVSEVAGTTMDPVEGHFDLFFGPQSKLIDEHPLFPTAQEQLWEEYQALEGEVLPTAKLAALLTENAAQEELRQTVFERPLEETEASEDGRDAAATQDTNYWRSVQVVDTAGIRKKKLVQAPLEVQAVHRALQALAAAEVVLYVADATCPLGHQDRRLLDIAKEKGKSIILCLNKTDLLRQKFSSLREQKTWLKEFADFIPWPNFCEVVPISAAKKKGLGRLKKALAETILIRHQRISARKINAALFELVEQQSFIVPRSGGKTFKVRFATMIKSTPPTIIIFANCKHQIPLTYRRYLQNGLRQALGLKNTPLHLIFRKSGDLRPGRAASAPKKK